ADDHIIANGQACALWWIATDQCSITDCRQRIHHRHTIRAARHREYDLIRRALYGWRRDRAHRDGELAVGAGAGIAGFAIDDGGAKREAEGRRWRAADEHTIIHRGQRVIHGHAI